MLKTIMVLQDGTEISSGAGTQTAIAGCAYTESVNSGTELTLGSVCAAMAEISLITPAGGLQLAAGDEFTLFRDDGNTRHQLGIFIAEKPTRPTANTMKLTAYDRISRLDRDLTEWLSQLTGWPYSLYELAAMVCRACSLELVNTEIPSGSYMVQKFSAEGITGRKLIRWVAEAAGRFCRATADGRVEFAWYQPVTGHTIGPTPKTIPIPLPVTCDGQTLTISVPDGTVTGENGVAAMDSTQLAAVYDGEGTLTLSAGEIYQHFFFQGGLAFEDYATAPIEKVQIHANDEDVGVVWPNDTAGVNTYRITGNLLLSNEQVEALQPVAQALYTQLQAVTYTPCRVSLPADMAIRAGQILSVTDANGKTVCAYVMTQKQTGQKASLECTGSHRRDSVTAVNEQSYTALSGKVLNLRTDVDGLKAENRAADGRLASIEMTIEGISGRVEKQSAETDTLRTELTLLRQTAESVQITVQQLEEQGATKVKTGMGYTFDDVGLQIAREGGQMKNLLDNTGMYVTRSGETVLQANSDGVIATDVRVRNYLNVGNARFEPYMNDRTACFYVEE